MEVRGIFDAWGSVRLECGSSEGEKNSHTCCNIDMKRFAIVAAVSAVPPLLLWLPPL